MPALSIGSVFGLEVRVRVVPTVIASVVMWAAFALFGIVILQLPVINCIVGGLAAVALYWLSETVHNFGHAIAARQTGHPMAGMLVGTLGGLLIMSRYPKDEPDLPPDVHIRRASGGPLANLVLAVVAGVIFLLLNARGGGTLWWVSLFFLVWNIVLVLQIFVPLGFNDASTIRKWRAERDKAKS